MALIKCSGCGHMVSDKGTKCPKCGTPIHKVEEAAKPIEEKEKVVAEVESPKVEIPKVEAVPSIDEFANESKNSKRGIVAVVCGIVAIAIIGASYYLWKNHRTDGTESTIAMNDSISNIEMLDSAQVEEAITDEVIEDSVAFATVENVNESICEEYERLLDENRVSEGDCEYFLYDIDNDDMPELWMIVGSYEVNYRLLVYTYNSGIKQLYEDGAGHSYFCMGTNYILQIWGHMGEAFWSKLTYDGTKIVAKTVFEEDIRETDGDYTKPQEPEIEFHSSNDKQPIYDVFAVE